jgi:hypothetical protein
MDPRPGDRILVFRPQWLALILGGAKSVEVRGRRYSAGRYYLGCSGKIYACAQLGPGVPIDNMRQFDRLREQHQMVTSKLPYKRTFVFPILNLHKMSVPYTHPKGAITIVRYRTAKA